MVPIKSDYYEYWFNPNVLKVTRTKLGLSQAKLAEILDVPVNTLSRWETGGTAPDARALAAIYSIARKNDITPGFFVKRDERKPKKQRTKMLFAWDFQNSSLNAKDVSEEWGYMIKYINLLHADSRAYRILRAYTSPNQRDAAGVLKGLKFDVYEGYFDADSQLIRDTMEECGNTPEKWDFILVADDGDYAQMLRDLQAMGVAAYLWGSEECSERLQNAVGKEYFINWNAPYVVMTCMDVITSLESKSISRAYFGNLCKTALEQEEVYPDDVGFSRRNPYGSLLRWLEAQGAVAVTEKTGKSDQISIVVQGKP